MFSKKCPKLVKKLDLFPAVMKRGYKMTKLNIYQGHGIYTPSGIRVSIFGGNSNMARVLAPFFLTKGTPVVFNHRNTLDPISPHGDDITFRKSNPYYQTVPYIMENEVISTVNQK